MSDKRHLRVVRPTEDAAKFVPSPQQEAVFQFIREGTGHGVLVARAGTGKCLGRGTPVLMFDGRIQPAEQIQPNDLLMGPDSEPRTVESVMTGFGPLYRITPVKGESWVCNAEHVLTLTGTNRRYGEVMDVPLEEHLANCAAQGERPDRNWKLLRVGVNFPSRAVELDPYVVGLWLGNGTLGETTITSAEDEIFAACAAVARSRGYEAVRDRDEPHHTWSIRIRWPGGVGTRATPNLIRRFFQRLSECGEKRIPDEYLINDRRVRLQLLAGILDTDGYYNGGFEFTSKYETFASQVAYLARSLGFAAYVKPKTGTIKSLGFTGQYWRVSISGDLTEVPCLLPRRMAPRRRQIKRVTCTGFTATPIGAGPYVGFTLNRDGRFLLGDFTVTHNTETIARALDYVRPFSRVLCCAFNRRIRDALEKRVSPGIKVQTLHQLGRATLARERSFRGFVHDDDKDLRMAQIALSNSRFTDTEEGRRALDDVVDRVKTGAALVKAMLIQTRVELVEMLKAYALDGNHIPAEELAEFVAAAVRAALDDWPKTSFNDEIWMPIHHRIGLGYYDFIFVDECQDLTLAQLRLVQSALHQDGRILAVGDPAQCHPPGVMVTTTEGSVPIEQLDRTRHRIRPWDRNAQRVVGARAFDIGTRHFDGELVIVQAAGATLPSTPTHKFLCRWSDRTARTCVTYLMWRPDLGYRVGWCQLFNKSGTFHLGHRARIEDAERTWILKAHKGRTEASLYESYVAATYGLPTMTFEPVHGAIHLTTEAITQFFTSLNREEQDARGVRCLTAHGLDTELPIYPWPGKHIRDHQGRPTYFKCYAVNLIPEMMLIPTDQETNHWAPIQAVPRCHYVGPVYSLDVDENHTYVANGLVTLNSIYGWRGADENAVRRITEELKAKTFPLSVSFRCPKVVVARAQRYVPEFQAAENAPEGRLGELKLTEMYEQARAGDFVLSRLNAPLARVCLALVKNKTPARILGQDIGVRLIALLKRSKAKTVPDLLLWLANYEEKEVARLTEQKRAQAAEVIRDLTETLRQFADGELMVAHVMQAIDNLFVEDRRSYVICSTVHRLKGDEANRVFMLEETFFLGRGDPQEEANIHYVAITRAKRELYSVYGLYEKRSQ